MPAKHIHCVVDDTALITNIEEIEQWVTRSAISLVIPLHTIERLHLLKKDTSQIGVNAKKAVKFLDDVTSDAKLATNVVIQEAEERYATWSEVEGHYVERTGKGKTDEEDPTEGSGLSQVLTKLEIGKDTSPLSTPPLSPSSSGPQSSKTSPEVKNASVIPSDASPVPPSLKDLINSVVWYTHEKAGGIKAIFLTNSSDTAYLARDFGVKSKNVHQLRATIGEDHEVEKVSDKKSKTAEEPRTLFRYEDEESDEEEVIFKPRGRGASKTVTIRGNKTGSVRSKNGHSPANSLSAQLPIQPKPQIPIEEIDPDSFDRGSFGRGSTPLASVGNHNSNQLNNHRIQTRGNFATGGHSRGGYRGGNRGNGLERGSTRGRGRLFVP